MSRHGWARATTDLRSNSAKSWVCRDGCKRDNVGCPLHICRRGRECWGNGGRATEDGAVSVGEGWTEVREVGEWAVMLVSEARKRAGEGNVNLPGGWVPRGGDVAREEH